MSQSVVGISGALNRVTAHRVYLLLILALTVTALTGCVESQPCNCGCPKDTLPSNMVNGGRNPPAVGHTKLVLSTFGTYLGFVDNDDGPAQILNLATGTATSPRISEHLPPNMSYFGGGAILWCPYNDTLFAVLVVTFTDTVGDGKNVVYGQHLFETSIHGAVFKDVTPLTRAGAAGPHMITPLSWLQGSTESADSILAYFSNISLQPALRIFVPQTGALITRGQAHSGFLVQTPNGQFEADVPDAEYTRNTGPLYVNGVEIKFDASPGGIEKASWSPDGKKLALSVYPDFDTATKTGGNRQVWTADIDSYLSKRLSTVTLQIIDFQKNFCTYNSWGCYGQFLTNSTLAVTMHHIDEDASYIYEITVDGKLLRQLTTAPYVQSCLSFVPTGMYAPEQSLTLIRTI